MDPRAILNVAHKWPKKIRVQHRDGREGEIVDVRVTDRVWVDVWFDDEDEAQEFDAEKAPLVEIDV